MRPLTSIPLPLPALPVVTPIEVTLPRFPSLALGLFPSCRDLSLVYPPDHIQKLRERIDGEVCPDQVLTKEAVIAVNIESACGQGHFDIGGMIADHQEFVRRDLKALHDEVKRRRVGLQLRERVSAGDIREPCVEAVLL